MNADYATQLLFFSPSLFPFLSFSPTHAHTAFSVCAQPRFTISPIGEKKTKFRLRRAIHGEVLGQCLRDCWRVQGQPRALIHFPARLTCARSTIYGNRRFGLLATCERAQPIVADKRSLSCVTSSNAARIFTLRYTQKFNRSFLVASVIV